MIQLLSVKSVRNAITESSSQMIVYDALSTLHVRLHPKQSKNHRTTICQLCLFVEMHLIHLHIKGFNYPNRAVKLDNLLSATHLIV